MATTEIATFCDICLIRDLNKLAEEFCPQCEEILCGDCRNHHKISKSSKSHQTISIGKYNKLPSFIKQIKHTCEEHDCSLEFYCKSHDSLCCKLCLISGHKECKETIFIEDFLTPSQGHQSAALSNVEKVLIDLGDNISFAIKDRNRNMKELREQKRVIVEKIKEKRQEINTVLDHLEGELLEKVSALEKTNCREIEEIITKLEEEKEKLNENQKDVESVKMFASNLQIFMGTKAFQERILTNEVNVQQVYDNGSLNNVTMKCTFNEKLEGFIKHIKTFGDVEIDNSEKRVSFSWKGDKSAQFFKSEAKSIETINVRLGRRININSRSITGCAISEAGNILFLQLHRNSMMKYAPNGKFISESRIKPEASSIGYDLAVIDSNTVAVSSGGNPPQQIYLIDMNSTNMSQVLQLGDWCCG
ncbi:tripartite motif-containing protein 55-like isoform X2 [Mytilus edulis]|uniref:tripartite motif-containing protein 55-like isoform X2 n=1 Tax=Mytilus edulis TaxID=6550 RepID=UPI0039EDF450